MPGVREEDSVHSTGGVLLMAAQFIVLHSVQGEHPECLIDIESIVSVERVFTAKWWWCTEVHVVGRDEPLVVVERTERIHTILKEIANASPIL
jgi:hypothetical protein